MQEKIKLGILFVNKNILEGRTVLAELLKTSNELADQGIASELVSLDDFLSSLEKRLKTLQNKFGTATRISQKEFWAQLHVMQKYKLFKNFVPFFF